MSLGADPHFAAALASSMQHGGPGSATAVPPPPGPASVVAATIGGQAPSTAGAASEAAGPDAEETRAVKKARAPKPPESYLRYCNVLSNLINLGDIVCLLLLGPDVVY